MIWIKRITIAFLGFVLLLSVVGYAYSVEKEMDKSPACAFCGMAGADMSSVFIKANLKDASGKERNVVFDSLACWLQYEHELEKGVKVSSVLVLDYPTREDKSPKFIDLKKSYFVQVKSLKHSMPPYLVAFSDKAKAEAFAKEKGAKVLSYANAVDFVMKKIGMEDHQHKEGEHNHDH